MLLRRAPRAPAALSSVVAVVVAVAGCPAPSDDDAPTQCPGLYIGDAAADAKIEIVFQDAAGALQPIGAGDVPLLFPPQGGRVMFVGARVTNVNACAATLTGAIRDPSSKKLQLDKRSVNVAPTADGWGAPAEGDTSSFANIPACPNQWSETNLYDGTYELTVLFEDADGKSASATATVHPFCGEPENEAQCRCICKQGYVLGDACAPAP